MRDALALIFEHTYVSPVQALSVEPSLVGHVLAEDVHARGNLPPGPSTNIDGYALSAASTPPGVYKVVTTFPTTPMPPGSVYRINTGAPLPPGTDACIMVEDTEVASRDAATGEEETVRLVAQVDGGENVRGAGSDVRTGDEVLRRGDVVSDVGGELGTLAFVGQRSVRAYRRPVVAVLSTGNELRDLQDTRDSAAAGGHAEARFAGIVDSNRPTLLGVLQSLHFETIDLGICGDSMADTTARLKKGKEEADVVITTGGTSMGVGDLLKPCIERELGGTVHFGRVAMKPGYAPPPRPASRFSRTPSQNLTRFASHSSQQTDDVCNPARTPDGALSRAQARLCAARQPGLGARHLLPLCPARAAQDGGPPRRRVGAPARTRHGARRPVLPA